MTPPERKKHEESNNHPFGNALGSRTTLGGIRSGNNSDAVCRMLNRRGHVRRGFLRIGQDTEGGVMNYRVTINFDDLEIEVDCTYFPGAPSSFWLPAEPASVEVDDMYLAGEKLSENQIKFIVKAYDKDHLEDALLVGIYEQQEAAAEVRIECERGVA